TVVIPNKPTAGVTLSPVPRCPLASTETVRALFRICHPEEGMPALGRCCADRFAEIRSLAYWQRCCRPEIGRQRRAPRPARGLWNLCPQRFRWHQRIPKLCPASNPAVRPARYYIHAKDKSVVPPKERTG